MHSNIDRSAAAVCLRDHLALAVAMGIGRFAFVPLLPMMQVDFGLSLAQGGALASANYLGYMVGALLAMRQRWVPSQPVRIGLVMVVATTALMAAGESFAMWALWRFVAGVASAWVLVATAAEIPASLARLGRQDLAGVSFAGVGSGIAVAGLLCLMLRVLGAGAAAIWVAMALVAAAGLALTSSRNTRLPVAPDTAAADKLPPGTVFGLSACYTAFGFGYIVPASFLPAQARAMVDDPAVFGWVWPVFGAAAAISTAAFGRIGRQAARRRVWSAGHALMAVGVILPMLWPSVAGLIIAALCVGGTFMVVTLAAMQEVSQIAGASRQRIVATMTVGFALGQFIGPLVFAGLARVNLPVDYAVWAAGLGLMASAVFLYARVGTAARYGKNGAGVPVLPKGER